MREMSVLLLIIFLLCSFIVDISYAEEVGYDSLEKVLETFVDSRKTRDLKENGSPKVKESFVKTLENRVYNPVDQKVIEHLSGMPKYEGKRIITHDFRTPGSEGVSVNTDRDVRVLVEVEPERWIEAPVKEWEEVYYREFAKRTSKGVTSEVDISSLKEHAAKYRQLPTDRFHIEASRDYSDAGTIKVYKDGTKVVSTPPVVRVKKGLSRLTDPEGLAKMYLEKADEQFRQAEDIELRLQEEKLTPKEILELQDQQRMHETEGAVQLKKGVNTLEELRAAYQKQGYDAGRLPKGVAKAAEIVKEVKGTTDTDIGTVRGKIKALQVKEIGSLSNLNQKVSSQIESLKLAKKKQQLNKNKGVSLNKAGKAAGIAGDIFAIKDSLKKAEEGSHLLINFSQDDSKSEELLKTMGVAAIELSPVPVLEAAERGWKVDEEEKSYLKMMEKRGEMGGWETHPLTSIARVSTKVIYRTVESMTIDPLVTGGTAIVEGERAITDMSNNFINQFSHLESKRLQKQKMEEYIKRGEKFDLSFLSIIKNMRFFYGLQDLVVPDDELLIRTKRTKTWTDEYRVRWELTTPEGAVVTLKESLASSEGAERLAFKVPVLSPGEYTIRIRVFARESNLQVDFSEKVFKMSEKIGLGEITARKEANETSDIKEIKAGEIVFFKVDKIGTWNNDYWVQWLVNGERYQSLQAKDERANQIRFKAYKLLKKKAYKVAVRILDKKRENGSQIVAHQSIELEFKEDKIELAEFEIEGIIEGAHEESLKGRAAQNGDILNFSANVTFPDSEESLLTRLVWQVYDGNGKTLAGLNKRVVESRKGGSEEYRFRFRPDDFGPGEYTVALTHILAAEPENRVQAQYKFRVKDKIELEKLILTADKDKLQQRNGFYPDEQPFFYVYYNLASELEEVLITLSAAQKDGQMIDSVTVKRPREGEAPPYRIGYTIPPGSIATDEYGVFRVEISDGEGRFKNASREFKVVNYRLYLELPKVLPSGKAGPFRISPPDEFEAPYQVELEPEKGLGLGYQPGELRGTITGIVNKDLKLKLKAKVIDAKGRVAYGEKLVKIAVPYKVNTTKKYSTKNLDQSLLKTARYLEDCEDAAEAAKLVEEIKELVKAGADVNARAKNNETALHLVSRK